MVIVVHLHTVIEGEDNVMDCYYYQEIVSITEEKMEKRGISMIIDLMFHVKHINWYLPILLVINRMQLF